MRSEETGDTRPPAFPVHSSVLGQAGIGLSTGKALAREATKRLRFDALVAGWLLSILLHGCFCCRR